MKPAIRVEGLSKQYRIGVRRQESYRTLRESLADVVTAPLRRLRRHEPSEERTDQFWALNDVSFDVQPGEVVGIIGRNGAGKSTLLKILSRVVQPTRGRAEIRGRMGSLLEVGTGFHPELTGRENIYLNGSILGMGRKEIDRKFDEIIAFSEIDQFLDTPVKRYSSGMYVRLAFAVAAHLEHEILFVDEVLAVGDQQFQKKCLGKLEHVSREGRTVVFVSHDMSAINKLTTRCLFLRRGKVACFDRTREAIGAYLQQSPNSADGHVDISEYRRGGNRDSTIRFSKLRITQPDGKCVSAFNCGDSFVVEATYSSAENLPNGCFAFWLTNDFGVRVATFFSSDQHAAIPLRPGTWTVRCEVQNLPLTPGRYAVTIGLNQQSNSKAFDVIVDVPALEIVIPTAESGEMDWANRPWGAVHWENVSWSIATEGSL